MNYYGLAFWKIISSWFVIVAALLDGIGILLTYYKGLNIPPIVYIGVLVAGFLLSCVSIVAKQLRALDSLNPLVISDDNLSLGGPDMSVDSISIVNIGGGKAKITNISSDASGMKRIIDNHYMETFILDKGSNRNVMINESKIIDVLRTNVAQTFSIVRDWKEPFFIYIWYESLTSKEEFCTKVRFQSGDKFIRNLGWEKVKIN